VSIFHNPASGPFSDWKSQWTWPIFRPSSISCSQESVDTDELSTLLAVVIASSRETCGRRLRPNLNSEPVPGYAADFAR
jgi:hypothetical protein